MLKKVIIFLLCSFAFNLKAQWTQHGFFEGASLNRLLIYPPEVFVSGGNGIYKSNSSVFDWKFTADGARGPYQFLIEKILKSGTNILVINLNNFAISYDRGQNWKTLDRNIDDICVLNDTVYGAKSAQIRVNKFQTRFEIQLHRSVDFGLTFHKVTSIGDIYSDYQLFSSSKGLFIGETSGDGMLQYLDPISKQLKPFTKNGLSPVFSVISRMSTQTKDLFMASLDGVGDNLYRFNELTQSWIKIGTEIPGIKESLFLDEAGGYLFYSFLEYSALGFQPRLYRSSDNGLTWSNLDLQSKLKAFFHDIKEIQAGKLVAATTKGVFVSSDGGYNWQPQNTNLWGTTHKKIVADECDLFTVHEGVIYKSTDAGISWFRISSDFDDTSVCELDATINKTLIVNGVGLKEEFIYRSEQQGASFVKMNHPINLTFTGYQLVGIINAQSLIIRYDNGTDISTSRYFRTDNYGETYTELPQLPKSVNAYFFNGTDSLLFATGYDASRLFVKNYQSTDRGNNWELTTDTYNDSLKISAFPKLLGGEFYLTEYGTAKRIFKWNSEKWVPFNNKGLPEENTIRLFMFKGSLYYATENGFYTYSELQQQWIRITEGMYDEVSVLSADYSECKNKIYATTIASGIWEYNIQNTSLTPATALQGPVSVYPNPSDFHITIHISQNQGFAKSFQLTDLLGKVVYAEDISQKEKDLYRELNVENYPAGMYLLSVKMENDQIITSKVLIK